MVKQQEEREAHRSSEENDYVCQGGKGGENASLDCH
jgi:hypothetical protein